MIKKRKGFMSVVILLGLLMVFFGCEADSGLGNDSSDTSDILDDTLGILDDLPDTYSAKIFLGEWEKDGSFPWIFQNDGTISAVLGVASSGECCCGGAGGNLKGQYNYFFKGNYLVTYGPEMIDVGQMPNLIVAANFTLSDDGLSFTCDNGQSFNGLTFTRENGQSFTRGEALDTPDTALVLSNALLGTWKGDDGKEYVFGSDSGLTINSKKYGYLVKDNDLVTLGPFVKGVEPVLQKYKFAKVKDNIYLQYTADDKYFTITLSE